MMLIFFIGTSPVLAKNYNAPKKEANDNPKYASLIMDADTGRIISQRYADKTLHPASLTKMMTLLLTFEALESGKTQKNSNVRISSYAASMAPSKLGLPVGSTIKVEDAIKALATKSANDIAVALAEHVGGSEKRFASMMTARANNIGMDNTRFRNASGLHDPAQVTTARDMAKLANYIIQRYPQYYKYFSTRSFTYQGKTYRNHNRLLETYSGMDGFKTGYINASGFNLVASAHRNGHRLIGVVFGGRSGKSRNDHMAELLDYGFKKVGNIRTASTSSTTSNTIPSYALNTPPIPETKPTYGVASARPATQPTNNTVVETTSNSQIAYASLSSLSAKPTTRITSQPVSSNNNIEPNYADLDETLKEGAFGTIIGEGDFDPSVSKRIETGLIAMAVHKGDYKPNPAPASQIEKKLRDAGHAMVDKMGQQPLQDNNTGEVTALYDNGVTAPAHPKDVVGKWAVQIGAFNSRIKTDDALREAKKKLPAHLTKASAMTVPLNTDNGMIFRARLGGMNEDEARDACKYFAECITVAPIATRVSAQ